MIVLMAVNGIFLFLMYPDKEYGFDNIYKHSDDGLAEACAEYLSRKHKTSLSSW